MSIRRPPRPEPHEKTAATRRTATTQQVPREIEIESLLHGDREIVLLHNGEQYRLRITANDRLILTK